MQDDRGRTLLTIRRAAERAGVTTRTIYAWIKDGKIQVVRTAGGTRRVVEASLWRSDAQRETR